MKLPDFLVIGAMKCGTTTLYHDLARHPQIFLADKECGDLTRPVDRGDYARHFLRAPADAVCGDVSTTYAMAPDVGGVPCRRMLLGADCRIIYVVREPIQRAISHHYHYQSVVGLERMAPDFGQCVRRHSSLVSYGCYAMQLDEWLRHWEASAIRVVRFEDYVADRRGTLADLATFLGVGPWPANAAFDAAKNVSRGKPVLNAFWERIALSGVYRGGVRRWLPQSARERLGRLLLPTAPAPPAPPSPETVDRLARLFAPDALRLEALTGRGTPYWDWQQVRDAHLARWQLSRSASAAPAA